MTFLLKYFSYYFVNDFCLALCDLMVIVGRGAHS